MSILLPHELPNREDLLLMTPEEVKRMADKYVEPYRILRTHYLELLTAHKALRQNRSPNTWCPEAWKKQEMAEKYDDARLASHSPLGKLAYMEQQSRVWFLRWSQCEAEVGAMNARLVQRVGPETEEDVHRRLEAWGMIR